MQQLKTWQSDIEQIKYQHILTFHIPLSPRNVVEFGGGARDVKVIVDWILSTLKSKIGGFPRWSLRHLIAIFIIMLCFA